MILSKSLASSVDHAPAEVRDPDQLSRLAQDFDRWGLAPEAEVARLRHRQLVVKAILDQGRATGSRASSRSRQPRNDKQES